MAKKMFLTIIFSVLFVLALTTLSFAESNTTTKLGNEVTSSMNKTERKTDDLSGETENSGDKIKKDMKDVGNTIMDGENDVKEGIEDLGDEDNKDRTDNKAVAGTTGNYASGEIQDEGTGRNGMTGNAWIWIVMVVVALIIIAAVWYYATQK